jgi:electron transport complex protein RnfE
MGFLMAIKNAIDWQIKLRADADKPAPVKGAKRIRTTGNIS